MTPKLNTKFKLILGLGNKDTKSALETALLYAQAGARFFDISPEIFVDLKKCLKKNGFNLDDFTLCVSVPSLGDIHGRKAVINDVICSSCKLCAKTCPQNAIIQGKKSRVDEKKCIGCGLCKKTTNCYAISFVYGNDETAVLKKLVEGGNPPDMVELHSSVQNKTQILADFKNILTFFKGSISVCINRSLFPLNETTALLNKMREIYIQSGQNANSFYVQADGASMNGAKADKSSTVECIEFAKELAPFGFNLIISGGTNFETLKILENEAISPIIAYGSFARKLVLGVKKDKALALAKELVEKTE